MCPPTFYQIRYEINPWMKLSRRANRERAHAQWQGIYLALQSLGAKIQLIRAESNCPDMVFTANAGVVSGHTFIPSHFRFPERRHEEPAFATHFRRRGFTILDAARATFFEGEGDLLPYRDLLFGGFHFRSE